MPTIKAFVKKHNWWLSWAAKLLLSGAVALGAVLWGDHQATARIQAKVSQVEVSVDELSKQTSQLGQQIARWPTPESVVRKEEVKPLVESMQRQLDSIERQVSEIRSFVMNKK